MSFGHLLAPLALFNANCSDNASLALTFMHAVQARAFCPPAIVILFPAKVPHSKSALIEKITFSSCLHCLESQIGCTCICNAIDNDTVMQINLAIYAGASSWTCEQISALEHPSPVVTSSKKRGCCKIAAACSYCTYS